MKKVVLKPKRAAAVKRFHPWVFSGAIKSVEKSVTDGEIVEVYDAQGQYLATGHYQHGGSISVRIFSFQQTNAGQEFWNQRIAQAYAYRQAIGLIDNPQTNCYRLMHAEGDGAPGLIIDVYGHTAVVQCHSIGMHLALPFISKALQQQYGKQLQAIYDKSKETLPKDYAATIENQYLFGQSAALVVKEYGHAFKVDWESGQKTGFFLDQRENRQLLAAFCTNKKVLNAFCYSGGFSIYALQAGASHVDSVDISRTAIQLTEENVGLNGFSNGRHNALAEDVMAFLKTADADYDVMIVDPPAFAKNIRKRHNAVQGYKRLNALALQKIKAGGILFTFSCSQVVDKQLFYDTIVAAALESGRQLRVLHWLSQPPDHPVNIYHPEGAYLKGLIAYVL
jgi:23S rRNA (cytosine1962-C5)-methyltransferase